MSSNTDEVTREVELAEREAAQADESGRYACDSCHEQRGVVFVDTRYSCARCARNYLRKLERERGY